MKKIKCWLFGHKTYDSGHLNFPCSQCGDHDVGFEGEFNPGAYFEAKYFIKFWGFRKWLPRKCPDCGKRYGKHDKCVPF